MSERIRLSPGELFLLWWALDLGHPPQVLGLPRPGTTPERRACLAAEASERLSARGLGTVHEPAPALATALRRLAGAHTTLDLRTYSPDGPRYSCGALTDRGGVTATRVGDEIQLGAVTSANLVESLLRLLPPLPAARGLPANISVVDYTNACQEGTTTGVLGFVRVLRAAGVREPDAATVARAVTARQGGGQLGATGRGIRGPSPVTWVDTPSGRYALRQHGQWVTVTPADTARLATMADDMLAAVH